MSGIECSCSATGIILWCSVVFSRTNYITAVVLSTSPAIKEAEVKLLCARYHERQRSVVATAAATAVDVIVVVCAWRLQRRLQGR